ncbi:efflux RND transporter periplasmic adaptor subunit [Geobacter sp. DSM 9736]|uniref:efflux RND transporter periplasmic adaptor subunit n=1 Tax=Geobacter sp. DSM 9736 TaxID=1277350 RepID=UPI000B61E0FE|nr:efflux RND transporter periplasmic adaptor subunit [Geobacter sp. DSM 9736]SNB47080.1 RND family efflux transporter, MFP subunit [Geobacter sp. DSM 9736]
MKRLSAGAAVAGIYAVLLTSSGCSGKHDNAPPPAPPTVRGVAIQQVGREEITDFFAATGTVRSAVVASVAARVAGTVTAVHVREGERVSKGKLLVTVQADENASGAAGAAAAVEEASLGVKEALARRKLAEDTFRRFEKLYLEQAVTRQEYETRLTERDVAEQGASRAEARLAQAREQARAAGTIAGYSKITAPMTGIVTAKAVETGATVFPGTPLVTIEQEKHYRLEASVPDNLASGLRLGQELEVSVDGVGDALHGRVVEVSPVADPDTRTATVKIDITGNGLRTGMFGRARIAVGRSSGIVVPKGALLERGMLSYVWVVGTDNSALLRLVKTGRELAGRVEIVSGLAHGERVVTGGGEKVAEGARVQQ